MKFAQALRSFTKWFHLLGQSCYSSVDTFSPTSNGNHNVYAANVMPSIVLLVLMVSTAFGLCSLILYFSTNTFLDYLIIFLCVASMVITVSTAVSQSITLRPQFLQLFQQINAIELLTRSRFTINFSAFRCYYLRQILAVFVACVAAGATGSYIFMPRRFNDFMVAFTVMLLRFVTLITMFHLLFYICLFHCFVRAFARYVEIQANASTATTPTQSTNVLAIKKRVLNPRNTIIELNYFKLIHFNLWEISDTMNRVFGWTFTAVLFQLSMYSIYMVYFTFVALLSPKFEYDALRKSNLIDLH